VTYKTKRRWSSDLGTPMEFRDAKLEFSDKDAKLSADDPGEVRLFDRVRVLWCNSPGTMGCLKQLRVPG